VSKIPTRLQLQSRLVDPEAFGQIIVKSDRSGASVRLADIARVELGKREFFTNSRLNKQNAGAISIYQVPGSNALEVAEEVKNNGSTGSPVSHRI
jgi:multidrug efflux pump subunit AcrB